jgi:hypothetical protein
MFGDFWFLVWVGAALFVAVTAHLRGWAGFKAFFYAFALLPVALVDVLFFWPNQMAAASRQADDAMQSFRRREEKVNAALAEHARRRETTVRQGAEVGHVPAPSAPA